MDAKQKIIQQENERINQLVAKLDKATNDLQRAGEAYEQAWDEGSEALEQANDLDNALMQFNAANRELASYLSSLWRSGYRLS